MEVKQNIADLDCNFSDQVACIDQIQAKVDLAMPSLGQVQQEQIQVARALKVTAPPPPKLVIPPRDGAGLMGSRPSFPPPPTPQYHPSHVIFPPSPILPDPAVVSQSSLPVSSGDGSSPRDDHPISGGSEDVGTKRVWLPKMGFPKFDGTDVRIWLDKCSAYFQLFQIPEAFKVTAATMSLLDRAAHWYQAYKDSYGDQTWDQFQSAILAEFEGTTHREWNFSL
jgi:hypothetical protein